MIIAIKETRRLASAMYEIMASLVFPALCSDNISTVRANSKPLISIRSVYCTAIPAWFVRCFVSITPLLSIRFI